MGRPRDSSIRLSPAPPVLLVPQASAKTGQTFAAAHSRNRRMGRPRLAIACVGLLIYIVMQVPDGSRWPWVCVWAAGTGLLSYLLYRLNRWMLFRATFRRYGPHLKRHLRATVAPMATLQKAAEALGKSRRNIRRFLDWAAPRV